MVELFMISISKDIYALAHCVAHKVVDKIDENGTKRVRKEGG